MCGGGRWLRFSGITRILETFTEKAKERKVDYLSPRTGWKKLACLKRVPYKKYHHTSSGFDDVLASGWREVAAAYGLSAGDMVLFELANQQEYVFDVRKI